MRQRLCAKQTVSSPSFISGCCNHCYHIGLPSSDRYTPYSILMTYRCSSASIVAPPLGGILLDLDVSFPTYVAAFAFFAATACAFALPFESAADLEGAEKSSGERYTLLH